MPNTCEGNAEMCAPTAPKISEMCSLKPFSCLLLLALAEKTKTGFAGKYSIEESDLKTTQNVGGKISKRGLEQSVDLKTAWT